MFTPVCQRLVCTRIWLWFRRGTPIASRKLEPQPANHSGGGLKKHMASSPARPDL